MSIITETLSQYDSLVRWALEDGDVIEVLVSARLYHYIPANQEKQPQKTFYRNCKCSKVPEHQAAFNTPYFLHRIIPDFRHLGDTGDRAKFVKHQRKCLRKHDEWEASKNNNIGDSLALSAKTGARDYQG